MGAWARRVRERPCTEAALTRQRQMSLSLGRLRRQPSARTVGRRPMYRIVHGPATEGLHWYRADSAAWSGQIIQCGSHNLVGFVARPLSADDIEPRLSRRQRTGGLDSLQHTGLGDLPRSSTNHASDFFIQAWNGCTCRASIRVSGGHGAPPDIHPALRRLEKHKELRLSRPCRRRCGLRSLRGRGRGASRRGRGSGLRRSSGSPGGGCRRGRRWRGSFR